jgi:hypothetical protein
MDQREKQSKVERGGVDGGESDHWDSEQGFLCTVYRVARVVSFKVVAVRGDAMVTALVAPKGRRRCLLLPPFGSSCAPLSCASPAPRQRRA